MSADVLHEVCIHTNKTIIGSLYHIFLSIYEISFRECTRVL